MGLGRTHAPLGVGRRWLTVGLVLIIALSVMSLTSPARAGGVSSNALVPGALRTDATFEHIGVFWEVDGDLDFDSTMTVEYRAGGTGEWSPAAPAMRSDPEVIVDGEALGINAWAASAMFLSPGTDYELRVTLTDPDGGGESRTVNAATRTELAPGDTIRHVVPGSGGGNGTVSDPFRGLQAAADAARPGDTFEVEAGTYAPFQITTSGSNGAPITFRSDGRAVIDGGGIDRGVVTIGEFDRVTSHLIIEGFVIRDGAWGVDAQNTQDIAVVENVITDVDFGVYNRRDNNDERNQTVCNNQITGRVPWPGEGIPGERGIDLRGWGNVVCNNAVANFGDCVSVQPSTGASFGNDVYGNDSNRCVDDGIEVDYNQSNVRVYSNRVTNSRMGVSVQPISGGPAYIFRNELFNLESSPIKLNNQPSGVVVAHNTAVMNGNGLSDGSAFTNTIFRNNLFLGTRYAFEFTTVAPRGVRDFDHNAWGTSRSVEPGGPWFKWDNVRYDRISDLPDGVEDSGVEVGFADLSNAALPASWDVEVAVGGHDLTLVAGSGAIDAGARLDNLNDPFVSDGAPDMGAFEVGAGAPDYGPGDEVGGGFIDTGGSVFADDIEWLADQGITRGCNPPVNDRFCPSDGVTRGQMAAFLVRALGLSDDGGGNSFVDDDGSVFEGDIARLAAAGITRGCNPPVNDRFCPSDGVTRGQMAAFLVRALGLSDDGGGNSFVDDDGLVFEGDIARLAAAGITRGCNPPDNDRFCPSDVVTRGQMAAFLRRALG